MRGRFAPLLVFVFLFAAASAQAGPITILNISGGSSSGNVGLDASNQPPNIYGQWLAISFSLSQAYTNVSFAPTLAVCIPCAPFSGTAYLTNTLPTTIVLASNPFTISSAQVPTPTTVLSGLTLSPGTYFLVVTANIPAPGGTNSAGWTQFLGSTMTLGPGVTPGTIAFVNGNGFDANTPTNSGWYVYGAGTLSYCVTQGCALGVDITGSPVPEPGTMLLVASGLTAGWLRRRRKA